MSEPKALRQLPECDCCLLYAHDYHLICAVHPAGPEGDTCLDFRPDPDLDRRFEDFLGLQWQTDEDLSSDEEQWHPEEARFVERELVIERDRSFYNGDEIIQPEQRWTPEEQLELLDHHPLFTGKCPMCGYRYPWHEGPHWDCPHCGWVDDSV